MERFKNNEVPDIAEVSAVEEKQSWASLSRMGRYFKNLVTHTIIGAATITVVSGCMEGDQNIPEEGIEQGIDFQPLLSPQSDNSIHLRGRTLNETPLTVELRDFDNNVLDIQGDIVDGDYDLVIEFNDEIYSKNIIVKTESRSDTFSIPENSSTPDKPVVSNELFRP